MGICLISLLISLSVFLGTVYIFSKSEKKLMEKSYALYGSIACIVLVNILLYCIYKNSESYWAFSILSVYLIVTAYIDIKTLFVFRIINFLFGLAGVILLLILNISVSSQCAGAFAYILLVLAEAHFGGMGKGDAFTLMVSIPYLMVLNVGTSFFMVLLVNTLIFNVLFLVFNIRKINFKGLKLKTKAAFTPAIAAGTILLVMAEGISGLNF